MTKKHLSKNLMKYSYLLVFTVTIIWGTASSYFTIQDNKKEIDLIRNEINDIKDKLILDSFKRSKNNELKKN